MGTRSYIVRGLGNPASFDSCSHGAGRRMSRTRRKRELTADVPDRGDGAAGLERRPRRRAGRRAPAAYKDIDQVMADQKDLVEIEHTLRQVLNYKG